MAIKAGTDNKRNMIIAGALLCVLLYLGISQLMSSGPAPARVAAPPVIHTATQPQATHTASGPESGPATGPAAHKIANANSALDPALHTEKLALSESIEYAGNGRNIFSADSAPVRIEQVAAVARPGKAAPPVYTPPPVPQPPAIDLRYFGYSATRDGKRQAFLLHGEDIFAAAAGEIVNHRYKIVAVDARTVQITDLSYNNTQTLQLTN